MWMGFLLHLHINVRSAGKSSVVSRQNGIILFYQLPTDDCLKGSAPDRATSLRQKEEGGGVSWFRERCRSGQTKPDT